MKRPFIVDQDISKEGFCLPRPQKPGKRSVGHHGKATGCKYTYPKMPCAPPGDNAGVVLHAYVGLIVDKKLK